MQMEERERVEYISSDQHTKQTRIGHDLGTKSVYISNSRMNRDVKDTRKVVEFIDSFSPFNDQHSLHKIVTGEIAYESINSEKYLEIGNHIIDTLIGKDIFNYTFSRSAKVKNMGSKNVVKLKDEDTGIDPSLLFQKMVIISQRDEIEVNDLIDYELCPHPPSLFESSAFLRKAEKSQLTKAIVIYVKKQCELPACEENVDCYVLDGGSLLHRSAWNKNSTYDAISDHYVDFVNKNYPNAI